MDPQLRQIAATLRERPFPQILAIEVTADCNLQCTMCHHPGMLRPKGRMPFELWQKCANQVASLAPLTDCWFSFCGEPLLAPDLLLRMLDYGGEVGLRSLNLNTNGMLLVPDLADRILDSPARRIVIGIDGFSREAYEKARAGGDRDVVYANVEYLLAERHKRERGPEVQVQFIEMDENEGEIEAFRSHWMERGATLKLRNKLSWGGTIATEKPEEIERIPCPWAITMLHVFWDGRVPGCPGDTEGEERIGNAWDEPLDRLWARLGPFRERHLSGRFDELPDRCHTCTDWSAGASKKVRPEKVGPLDAPVRGA